MLTRSQAEHLTMLATRAPSIHNTQPWQLVVTPHGVDVRADRSRELRVIDPVGRQLLMSCGSVLHHVEVAARALDLDPSAQVLLEPSDPDLVGHVRLNGRRPALPEDIRMAEAILHRSTFRRRFSPMEPDPDLMDSLRQVVEEQGGMLKQVADEDRLSLHILVEHAERELDQDPRYQEELAAWVWDPALAGERADGIPVEAVAPGPERGEEVPGRRFVAGRVAPAAGTSPRAEHPTYVVLTTAGDAPEDWVRAGKSLSALLLRAAEDGILAQPIGQVTDVAAERTRLRHELGLVGVPQLVLRLGRAEDEPERLLTPRRPVDEVLRWAVDR